MASAAAAAAPVAGAAVPSSESVCEEICWQLKDSAVMDVEEFEREMEAVLARLRAAESGVFSVSVVCKWMLGWQKPERRLVHFAAWLGNRAVLKEACVRTSGAPAQAAQLLDTEGNMLLHLAVWNGRLSVEDLQWVMSLHPTATGLSNHFGYLPLHLLAWHHTSLTPELVDALVETHPHALSTVSQDRALPLHCACANPHVTAPALHHLVSLHAAAAGQRMKDRDLPLHLLVKNHVSLTPELIDVVVDAFPQAMQLHGRERIALPLHCACKNHHMTLPALRHLVSLHAATVGASVVHESHLPLCLLVRNHESLTRELVDVVLEAFPHGPRAGDQGKYQPQHWACSNPHMTASALRYLLSLDATAAGTTNILGSLPLHLLARCHATLILELVDIVLDAYPQALQCTDQRGDLPLHSACSNSRMPEPVLRRLVTLHAAAASPPNHNGELPLHLLARLHESLTPELMAVVLEAYPQAVHTATPTGNLPLHSACRNSHMTAATLRHLVSLHAAAAGTPNQNGDLPLHLLVGFHDSLTPELIGAVLEAHPRALQTAGQSGALPLHCACSNQHLTGPVLRYLVSLHTAAASTANERGDLPLHLLVKSHKSLTPELVDIVVHAHPEALRSAGPGGNTPLHCACTNHFMSVEGFRSLVYMFPDAAALRNNAGQLPFHSLSTATSAVRAQLAKMLMEATDSVYPLEVTCSCADADTSSPPSEQTYVPPPPDSRWASRPHPLSRQGRLKAGLRAVVRGRESVWQFQTGGLPSPGLMAENCTPMAKLVQVGHGSLVRQRLAGSTVTDVAGMNEAVLRALELGHVEVVRDLLRGGSSAMRVSCTAEQACKWLGALMRHPQLDYSWLVEWMGEQCSVWGDVDLDRLCLEAAALSGDLALVESAAATWQTRPDSASTMEGGREELGERAVAGGSVAVLRWLRGVGLATYPTQAVLDPLCAVLAKYDRLEMMELLQWERDWLPRTNPRGACAVRAAAESGALRVLRWLHVQTRLGMGPDRTAAAIYNGHLAAVQFLYRHRNITQVAGDNVLAEAMQHSPPGLLAVVEYVLRHHLCGDGDDAVTTRVVVNACTATTVRVEVVRHLVSRAREEVLCAVEEALARSGARQAQDVFRAARLRLSQRQRP